jgi:hypothetical protein
MMTDEVLREVRRMRESYAAQHGFDVHAIVADLRQRDEAGDWPVVRLPPRRAALSQNVALVDVVPESPAPAANSPAVGN